ncbi:MAG: AAA family ATPase [Nanoarchaeota archaeon]
MDVNITSQEVADRYQRLEDRLHGHTYGISQKIAGKTNGCNGKIVREVVDTAFPLMDVILRRLMSTSLPYELASAQAAYAMAEYGLRTLEQKGGQISFLANPIDFAKTYPEPLMSILGEYSTCLAASKDDVRVTTANFFAAVKERASKVRAKYNEIGDCVVITYNDFVLKGFSSMRKVALDAGGPTLSDVAGYPEIKEYLQDNLIIMRHFKEIVDRMDPSEPNKKRMDSAYGLIPKGTLLHGLPGTGKNYIIQAFSNEAGLPFFYMSFANVGSQFYSGTSQNIKERCAEAARPVIEHESLFSIMFIDEIDGIGSKRTLDYLGEDKKNLETLFEFMDGHDRVFGVYFFGATNIAATLDDALLRSGRFSKQFFMGPLNPEGLDQAIAIYLRESSIFSFDGSFTKGVDQDKIKKYILSKARKDEIIKPADIQAFTPVGADISEMKNRATRKAILRTFKDDKPYLVTTDDWISAYNDILMENSRR